MTNTQFEEMMRVLRSIEAHVLGHRTAVERIASGDTSATYSAQGVTSANALTVLTEPDSRPDGGSVPRVYQPAAPVGGKKRGRK